MRVGRDRAHHGARSRRRRVRPAAITASTRSSTRRRATFRCRRRSPTRTASCVPACSCRRRSTLGASRSRHRAAGLGDQLRAVRRLGLRRRRPEGPEGQDLSRRAPAVREAGRLARRSGRGRRRASSPARKSSPPASSSCATAPPSRSTTRCSRATTRLPSPRTAKMKFTDLFVKRPVLAIVVNLVILIAGLQSIRSLSVRQYPRSDIAVVRCRPSTSARTPTWCAASSRRRSSA